MKETVKAIKAIESIKIVENIEKFSNLLKKYLSKDYANNANRLIRDYKALIEKEKLYYIERNNYLLFFEDCKYFYNLYYFISITNLSIELENLNFEKPIVADEIYTDNNLSASVDALLDAGFTKYMTRSHMKLKLSQKDGQLANDLIRTDKDSNVNFSNKDEVDLIYSLQEKDIDKYTGNALCREEILEEIKNNLILSIYEEAKFVGYLRLKKNKKSISLEGIVVDPSYRAKGYSKELVKYFIDYFSKEAYNEISLWVRDDNQSAIKLYNNFNFEKTKYKCDNYIKF
jgi:ribosomal protein S18 acetylase RimI-like enzyme